MCLVQTPENSQVIFLHCQVMWFMIGKALSLGHQDLALIYLGVYTTSVLHWKNPVHRSWRQRTDQIMVRIALFYYLYTCYYRAPPLFLPYFGSTVTGILCYEKAKKEPRKTLSMRWHLTMHYISHFSNWVLYSFLKK